MLVKIGILSQKWSGRFYDWFCDQFKLMIVRYDHFFTYDEQPYSKAFNRGTTQRKRSFVNPYCNKYCSALSLTTYRKNTEYWKILSTQQLSDCSWNEERFWRSCCFYNKLMHSQKANSNIKHTLNVVVVLYGSITLTN